MVSEPLPTRAHITKKHTQPSFPHGEANPQQQTVFLASQHSLIKPVLWSDSPGSTEGEVDAGSKDALGWAQRQLPLIGSS